MTRSASALSILALGLLAACSSTPDSDFSDENVATGTSALSSGLGTTGLASLSSNDPNAAATAAAAATDGDDCRTRSVDPSQPNVVHVVLNDCTGYLGRHHVSGTLTITYTANGDGSLDASLTSDSLTFDGRPATHEATAHITFDADMRHAVWHGVWTHTRPNGELATHNGDHTIDVNRVTMCRTVNGTGVTHVGDRQINSTITNLQTCEQPNDVDSCPTGTIEHDNVSKGRRALETFDGSNVATIQITNRHGERTRDVTLNCGPSSQVGAGST